MLFKIYSVQFVLVLFASNGYKSGLRAKLVMFHTPPPSTNQEKTKENKPNMTDKNESNCMKSEITFVRPDEVTMEYQEVKSTPTLKTKISKKSKTSSSMIEAQKKKLEYEAAQAKARIQMDLIEKKLAADLAGLSNEYSPASSEIKSEIAAPSITHSDIEKWVNRSQTELERQQRAAEQDKDKSTLMPPPAAAGTDGPVQQLACALNDLVATSVSNYQNGNLLSRISTPSELPVFAGSPMEWLLFKQAYEESSRVCGFSKQENLWRLRKCLRGPAREAVAALLMSATSPDIVMSTLELRFGAPEGIIAGVMHEIRKLSPLSTEYHKEIIPFSVKIKNYVAAVDALSRSEYLHSVDVVSTILSKLPSVLLAKWVDYSYPHITTGTKPKLKILSDFLYEESVKISTCSATLVNTKMDSFKRKYDSDINQQTVLFQSGLNDINKCRFCYISNHKLVDCKKFKKSLRKDRWEHVKRYGICYKCLISHHDRQTCPAPACDVDGCMQAHHRLLHYITSSRRGDNQVRDVTEREVQTDTVTYIDTCKYTVLLKVVPINIHGPNGVINTTALLDDGSTVSLVSASLAASVGLRGRSEQLRVRGAWDSNALVCNTQLIDLNLSNNEGAMFTITVRSMNELNLPKQNLTQVNCEKYKHLNDIKNNLCHRQLKPQILIGQDNNHLLLPLEIVTGKPGEPCATRTPLGWCLHGKVHLRSPAYNNSSLLTMKEDLICENENILREIYEEVRRYFSIDSMGVSSKPRENSEDLRAIECLERTSSLTKEGRWQVGLPWKNENCKMPDSYFTALSRLRGVEQKMRRSEEFARRYTERIEHLFLNDYAEELISPVDTAKTWYLPHFGVDNPNKKKLRLIFDAAAKSNGVSLNDFLLRGPDLLKSLFGIMLRFRENKIAVTGDIKDMFLRVKIRPEDRNSFRFLLRDNEKQQIQIRKYEKDSNKDENLINVNEKPLKTCVMTSLIFGANCSPFIAQFIKNKNALMYESSMPAAVTAIINQHYMDDYIHSVPDEKTAVKLVQDISFIHKQGGFEIRNWNSNQPEVLKNVPKENLGNTAVRFKIEQEHESERTLGLIWTPREDTLQFDVSLKRIPENILNGSIRPSKRDMLRIVMSIFDVYGFLSPFTITGKIILQDTWRLNIGWDDPISDFIYSKWQEWINLLKYVKDLRLPRYYPDATYKTCGDAVFTRYSNLQLHIFCDASAKAMCAVAYWRWIYNHCIYVAFIASKCRVCPVRPLSMPRCELQSALLAARLADTITKEHNMIAEQRYFWSDSTTVLHWISNNTRSYKAFVAHRLGEIDELSDVKEWRYVPTKLNVADVATRESCDCTAIKGEWLYGPKFLRQPEQNWPNFELYPEINKNNLECVLASDLTEKNVLPVPNPVRFSSWIRLLKSTYVMLSFIHKCRKYTQLDEENTLKKAEYLLLRSSQAESFHEELVLLKRGDNLPKSSRLLTLSPFIDEHGVLRADGRIDAAIDVSPETKAPVILDGRSYIARLIVRAYHIHAAHGNQEMVVNNLKQKYWIIKLRPTVKNVTSKCMICRIRKCKPEVPRIGDLPEARMAHHQRPFTHCGVDLFGPMEITVGRRREKRYGVLFTCLTIRAIHIEMVHNLTSDSFIMALRRMASRRSWPKYLYSDNATNFRGADVELQKSIQDLDIDILRREALNYGTIWKFIPPASPHWGGAWERLIRSVKTSLRIILKERAPKEEVLITVLSEVENMVNNRPLTHMSVELGDPETLTPSHFLLGSPSGLSSQGMFDDSDLYLKKQWRTSQRLADMYWKRWVREVLPEMVPRKKWQNEEKPLKEGDLVFIVDPDGPRNTWPRGRVLEVCPGKDGRVRVVKVKTAGGTLTRSVTRVAKIPVEDECC